MKLNPNEARQADRTNTAIKTSGRYVGVITRAEKLLSQRGTEGIGISFKADDGSTANYLDLYIMNDKGEALPSNATAQAILCCTRTKEAPEGKITFDWWDKEAKEIVEMEAKGYPDLMGKRIGLLLQQELSTNSTNSKEVDRVVIYGVFEASSGLTSSEILDKKTKPEKLEKMEQALMASPIRDRRAKSGTSAPRQAAPAGNSQSSGFDDFEDDIPF